MSGLVLTRAQPKSMRLAKAQDHLANRGTGSKGAVKLPQCPMPLGKKDVWDSRDRFFLPLFCFIDRTHLAH